MRKEATLAGVSEAAVTVPSSDPLLLPARVLGIGGVFDVGEVGAPVPVRVRGCADGGSGVVGWSGGAVVVQL